MASFYICMTVDLDSGFHQVPLQEDDGKNHVQHIGRAFWII
jgi:hypothetical protein